MGKFSRNREYTFANFDEFIKDVLTEFRDGAEIDIAVPYNEVEKFILAFLSNGFCAYSIDYAIPEVINYNKEYIISLGHIDDNAALFVETACNKGSNEYLDFYPADTQITFVSADVTMGLYQHLKDSGLNTVLYDFEQ